MTEYVPLYKPGQAVTHQASAAITGGQLVGVSGSGTVAPTGTNQASWVGVAAFDAAVGDQVTVHSGGVQRILAAGAVTAGDLLVASATAGRVSTLAAVTTPTAADVSNTRAIVGIALTSAADGELVEVQMDR
jgi:hypothetical protein